MKRRLLKDLVSNTLLGRTLTLFSRRSVFFICFENDAGSFDPEPHHASWMVLFGLELVLYAVTARHLLSFHVESVVDSRCIREVSAAFTVSCSILCFVDAANYFERTVRNYLLDYGLRIRLCRFGDYGGRYSALI